MTGREPAGPRTPRARSWGLAIVTLAALSAATCSATTSTATPTGTAEGREATTPIEGDLIVYAAASLRDVFDKLRSSFEHAHPRIHVHIDYDASSALATRLVEGAPADVFASADDINMKKVVDAGRIDTGPVTFAMNRMAIATPPDNKASVRQLRDFGRDELVIGLCAPEVPCGKLGREVLAKAGVDPKPDTFEPDVRTLLDKIEHGDVDAGIVYVTDVRSAGDKVASIDIADADNVTTSYPIGAVRGSSVADLASAFVAIVTSPDAGRVLRDAGFVLP